MGSVSPSLARIAPSLSSHNPIPKAVANNNVHHVVLGDVLFRTWYPSYYPEDLVGKEVERLYVCQWCFKYSKEILPYLGHMKVCSCADTPPGTLIYSKDSYAIYEVDGEEHQLYTQNLSLFAKLFLDNKSVFFDVIGFYYYLLVHTPDAVENATTPPRHQIVGFFSKEKMSWDNNNLACILIFPPWQRQGLGKILMAASYELSKREGQIGGPEKPLSELGKKGYYKFWEARIARTVLKTKPKRTLTVREIAAQCWLTTEDTIEALKDMNVTEIKNKNDGGLVISKARVKHWVGNNSIDLTPPVNENDFIAEAMRSRTTEES